MIQKLALASLLVLFSACSTQPSAPDETEEDVSSGSSLIESPVIWEAIQQGTENSPEIRYARKISARIEKSFRAELSQLPEANRPAKKCYQLPAIDVVMDAEGKVVKSTNRAKSCWVTGTRTALKTLQTLRPETPPAGLLRDGKFKFSWIPEIPAGKAE